MSAWNLLFDIVMLLIAALVLGALAAKLRQSPLVGYLLAGMAMGGPGSFHVIRSEHEIEAIAELGVALLLFGLGLEFSWNRLRSMSGRMLAGGAIQVVITLLVCAGFAAFFTSDYREAVVVGAMLSLSSTACVIRVLMDRGEVDSTHGRSSIAILLVQDMAVVPLALLIALLGKEGGGLAIAIETSKVMLLMGAMVTGLYVLNRLAVWGLRTSVFVSHRELQTLLAVAVGLGSAWAAHAAGSSPALGAFLAGMFLGASPFATQIRADISSLRVVLLTLFFSAAGMVANPIWMGQNWIMLVLLTVGVLLIKTTITAFILAKLRMSIGQAFATGLCLCQIGEFAFVLGTLGQEYGLLSEEVYMTLVSVTILTLLFSPYLVATSVKLGSWLERHRKGLLSVGGDAGASASSEAADVVVIGFGPAGRRVAEAMSQKGYRLTIIDQNWEASSAAATLGASFQMGDALHQEVLEHAGVRQARIVVVTLPTPQIAIQVIQSIRILAPTAHIAARSRHQRYVEQYRQAGAQTVVDEEHCVGEGLVHHLLEQ